MYDMYYLLLGLNLYVNPPSETIAKPTSPYNPAQSTSESSWPSVAPSPALSTTSSSNVIKRYQGMELPFMTAAKFSDFFTPPPCHCRKSADFVPIVCFLGTPHPLRTSYMEAPLGELCNFVFDSPPWSLRGLIDVDRQWECHIGNGASLIWTTTTEKRSPY